MQKRDPTCVQCGRFPVYRLSRPVSLRLLFCWAAGWSLSQFARAGGFIFSPPQVNKHEAGSAENGSGALSVAAPTQKSHLVGDYWYYTNLQVTPSPTFFFNCLFTVARNKTKAPFFTHHFYPCFQGKQFFFSFQLIFRIYWLFTCLKGEKNMGNAHWEVRSVLTHREFADAVSPAAGSWITILDVACLAAALCPDRLSVSPQAWSRPICGGKRRTSRPKKQWVSRGGSPGGCGTQTLQVHWGLVALIRSLDCSLAGLRSRF